MTLTVTDSIKPYLSPVVALSCTPTLTLNVSLEQRSTCLHCRLGGVASVARQRARSQGQTAGECGRKLDTGRSAVSSGGDASAAGRADKLCTIAPSVPCAATTAPTEGEHQPE